MDENPSKGRVLIIAGSDSSGGAGLQADIKTCAAFGAYSMTAVTAITVQNTLGVQQVELISAELVRAQIRACLSDIGADVIKIGMLGDEAIIEAVADEIADSEAFVILDPVMVATSGDTLLNEGGIEVLKSRLIPVADVLTPNVPEAKMLTGIEIDDVDSLTAAGQALLDMGLYAVLMKGGHLEGNTVVDVLVTEEGASMMSGPRIRTRHTHGTGCTLASALAAGLSLDVPLEQAVLAAREFVYEAIRTAPKLGQGNGPLNHGLVSLDADKEAPQTDDASNPFSVLKDL